MFFDDISQITELARKCGTAIFVVPEPEKVEIPGAVVLEPEGKASITIEQVREALQLLTTKQTEDRFVLVRPAEKLGVEAENAFLKALEEPGEKVHFVLLVQNLSGVLMTVRSRAAVFTLRRKVRMDKILVDEKTKLVAKRLLTAKPTELVAIAEELTSKKDGVRGRVLEAVSAAIEMGTKTYFLTGKVGFLRRVEKLLLLEKAVRQNGQIKLQIVANLV